MAGRRERAHGSSPAGGGGGGGDGPRPVATENRGGTRPCEGPWGKPRPGVGEGVAAGPRRHLQIDSSKNRGSAPPSPRVALGSPLRGVSVGGDGLLHWEILFGRSTTYT